LWEGLLCDFWPNSQCTQFVTSKWSWPWEWHAALPE
jgi:hypothetical protein